MRKNIVRFIFAVVIVSCAASLRAQEVDTVSHGRLYHILFDSTLTSRVPVIRDSVLGGNVTHYKGHLTNIDLRNDSRVSLGDSDRRLRIVDIRCSDNPEYAEIDRTADDTVEVKIYERDKGSGSKKGAPIFEHTFDGKHTKEIRIHLGGGDDYAIVRGNVSSSIDVHVVGGAGADELVDSSHVSGYFLHFTPFPKDQKKTYFYGEPNETNFIYSSSTVIKSGPSPLDDSAVSQPLARDWGRALQYNPWFRASSDEGAFIGAAISVIDYDFREEPYDKIMTFRGGYATTPSKYEVEFSEYFPHRLGGDISVSLRASSLDVLNFFGYGNTISLDNSRYSVAGYRLHQQQFTLSHGYSYEIFEHTSIWGTAALRYVTTDADPINDSSVIRRRYMYGVGPMTTARFSAGVAFDSRNEVRAPTEGIYASFASIWTPEIINNSYAYTSLHADIKGYLTSQIVTPVTLALRMNAAKLFGEHPFYESAFLGGASSLRGYYSNRFAGEESILASADLRIEAASLSVFVPSKIGILLFADAGRVYVDNDFSNLWHTSFGGGVWVAPVSREHTIVLTIGHSSEATQMYLTTGFAF
ncbi:MAG TPA: BamA/TamA family outer membrane protein [Candidatus Kapabacteria bacterium]|nr:BamA/TamA family outer membrane protein [Candidatus Kapabacteria bacterium]